jgi:hypothetical protein
MPVCTATHATHATSEEDAAGSEPVLPSPVARLPKRAVAIGAGLAAAVALWIAMPGATEPIATAAGTSEPATAAASLATTPAPASPPALAPAPVQQPIPAVEPPESIASAPLPGVPADEEPEPIVLAPDKGRASGGQRPAPMDRNARIREAKRLIGEARGLVFGQPAKALALARKSVALHPTDDGYGLLGMAACRSGDARSARKAYSHLRGKKRDDLVRACADRGIEFTIELER